MSEQIKRLADEYAHVYAFVGDDTMPLKRKELHSAIDKLTQRHGALEIIAVCTAGALEKAGFTEIDNPADAIEILAQQRDELLQALIETKKALEVANFSQPSPITDTLWMTKSETLFDFIDAAIAKATA